MVFGGGRLRGNYKTQSDIDIGFGDLNVNQASKTIKEFVKKSNTIENSVPIENNIKIVKGNGTDFIDEIKSPEEFFQRSGTRAGRDENAGKPYYPSGSITVTPDGKIVLNPPKN